MGTKLYFLTLFALLVFVVTANSQTPAFTYQGRLTDSTLPASGTYQMQFSIFDAVSGGAQIGSTLTFDGVGGNPAAVTVTNGVFTVNLDFSPATPFATGANRWIEIAVKKPAEGSFTTLTPRQPITSSPYSIRSVSAATADTATTASNFSGSLTGDVTGIQGATTVATVGGQSAASVAIAATTVASATSANTPSTLVRRDASGGFAAGIITGNGSGLTNLNGANLTAASVTTDKLAPVFGYFSNSFIFFTITPGGSIPFANAGPVSGIVSIGGGNDFILPDTGVYEVAWQVSVQEAGALALSLNGVQQPNTVVGRSTGTTQIVGHVLINANAGDVVSITAATGNPAALTIATFAGADPLTCSLVIKRIK